MLLHLSPNVARVPARGVLRRLANTHRPAAERGMDFAEAVEAHLSGVTEMMQFVSNWAAWYSASAVLRTIVGFVHVGGLLVAGGHAVVADRVTLSVRHADPAARKAQLGALAKTHRVVVGGLALIVLSGLLLLTANLDTYWHSKVFWIKTGVVVLLLANGAFIVGAEHRAAASNDAATWSRLSSGAVASLLLWLLTTLLGAALPNV